MRFEPDDEQANITEHFMARLRARIERDKKPPLSTEHYNAVFEEMYELVGRLLSDA